jgi:glycerol uptake facilitator-like aquaporin
MKDAVAATASVNSQGQRVSLARILRDSALELLLTFLMLFGVVSIVRWVIGPSPISQMIPEIHAELLIVGVAVAILIAGLIMSPYGRMTGGHMNPAISLAMWRFGVFPGIGVAPTLRCSRGPDGHTWDCSRLKPSVWRSSSCWSAFA